MTLTEDSQEAADLLDLPLCLPVRYPDVRLTVTLRRENNSFQTRDINCGPLSDTTSSGIPKCLNTWLNIASAVSIAVGRPLKGINLQALEKRSTITKIQVFPSDASRSEMKSTPRCYQG